MPPLSRHRTAPAPAPALAGGRGSRQRRRSAPCRACSSSSSPAAAAPAPPPPHPDAAAFAQLLAALPGARCALAGPGTRAGDGVRGLFATAPVPRPGTPLLSVPLRHCLVVTDGGSRDAVDASLGAQGVPPPLAAALTDRAALPEARLALWLLWAVAGGSPAWALAERGGLLPARGAFSVPAAAAALPDARALLLRPQPQAPPPPQRPASSLGRAGAGAAAAPAPAAADAFAAAVDDAALLWALSLALSRGFGADGWTRSVQDGRLAVVAPLADFANHSFNPSADFRLRAATGDFELVSRRPLAPGDEVTLCYGEGLANDELERRYGFGAGSANPNGDVTRPRAQRLW